MVICVPTLKLKLTKLLSISLTGTLISLVTTLHLHTPLIPPLWSPLPETLFSNTLKYLIYGPVFNLTHTELTTKNAKEGAIQKSISPSNWAKCGFPQGHNDYRMPNHSYHSNSHWGSTPREGQPTTIILLLLYMVFPNPCFLLVVLLPHHLALRFIYEYANFLLI